MKLQKNKKKNNRQSSGFSNYQSKITLAQIPLPDKDIVVPCFSVQFDSNLFIKQTTEKYLRIFPQLETLTFFNIETEIALVRDFRGFRK